MQENPRQSQGSREGGFSRRDLFIAGAAAAGFLSVNGLLLHEIFKDNPHDTELRDRMKRMNEEVESLLKSCDSWEQYFPQAEKALANKDLNFFMGDREVTHADLAGAEEYLTKKLLADESGKIRQDFFAEYRKFSPKARESFLKWEKSIDPVFKRALAVLERLSAINSRLEELIIADIEKTQKDIKDELKDK